MRKIVVFNNLTLDGVMQAPGRPDEDTRGDFKHGGWAVPFGAMQTPEAMETMTGFGSLLLGRRTYEDFYGFWPKQANSPFTDMLNNMPKYVASTTLTEPLPWVNSTLLRGDAAEALRSLKAQDGPDLVIMGSGKLIQSLAKANLIDRFVLLVHPLVLGAGRRMFADDGTAANLALVSAKPTSSGVVVAVYEPV